MIFYAKQGVKNILRAGRTSIVLFLILILLTVIIGTSYTASCIINHYVEQCNNSYHTVGIIDYPTADLSDDTVYDETVNDVFNATNNVLEKQKNIKWYPTAQSLGSVEGLNRMDSERMMANEAVLKVYVYSEESLDDTGLYRVSVQECLASADDIKGEFLYIVSPEHELLYHHTYLVHGVYTNVSGSANYMEISEFSHPLAEKGGLNGTIDSMVLDITDDARDEARISDFQAIADTLNVIYNAVTVYHTRDLDYAYEFQQKIAVLKEGQLFSEKEYQDAAKECIISDTVADKLGVKTGDKIKLSQAYGNETTKGQSYWSRNGFQEEDQYVVKGIFSGGSEAKYHIYVPYNGQVEYSHYSNTLGEIYFNNKTAKEDAEIIEESLPKETVITLHDQGYEAVMMPLQEMVQIITIIDIIAAATGVLFLLVFGYLFVYKKKDIARIMHLQGTGACAVYIFFMTGAAVLSIPAAGIGGAVNAVIANRLPSVVQKMMKLNKTLDYSFSNANLSVIKELQFKGSGFVGSSLLATVVVWITVGVVCLCFIAAIMNGHKKIHLAHHANREIHSKRGSGKYYAWFAIARGKGRVALLMVMCAVSMGLFLILGSTLKNCEDKEQAVVESAKIEGFYTDIHGRNMYGVTVVPRDIHTLCQTGDIEEVNYSKSFQCMFMQQGSADQMNSLMLEQQEKFRKNEYAKAALCSRLTRSQDSIVFTTDLDHTSEFVHAEHPQITFMDGVDEEKIFNQDNEKDYAIASEKFLQENHLSIGDEVFCNIKIADGYVSIVHAVIAGSFQPVTNRNYIYLPMNQFILEKYVTGDEEPENDWLMDDCTMDVCVFDVKGDHVDSLKKKLTDMGYTNVNVPGAVRKYIVLKDSQFLDTRKSIRQQKQYMQVFFPIIETILLVMAFLVPMLLVRARRQEIAIMRNLGTPKSWTFRNIYTEQFFISIAGFSLTVLTAAIYYMLATGLIITNSAVIFIAAYLVIWNLTSIVCISHSL